MRVRQRVLSPEAKAFSGICTSIIVFAGLTKVLPAGSKVPAVVLALMLMGSMRAFNIFASFVRPPMSNDRQKIINVVAALEQYKKNMQSVLDKKHDLYNKMPLRHRQQASRVGYMQRLQTVETKIDQNQSLLQDISQFAKAQYQVQDYELRFAEPVGNKQVGELIDHFVRDWCSETSQSRVSLFKPIIDSLNKRFGKKQGDSVLLPGSGLGRLGYDLANSGFEAECMEISPIMDIGSRFILQNRAEYQIYPYIHEFSHQITGESQLSSVTIPDVKVKTRPKLTFGDFTRIYDHKYDAVVTLFLIDTAENVFQYLEALARLVKPGGVWVNYGPLKWGTAPQVEFTVEELKAVIRQSGEWEIVQEFEGENVYHGNPHSLWMGQYKLRGWTAVRTEL